MAGDTVYIRAGTYTEQVTPQNSGSAGNTITYAAYPGETATIDGSGVTIVSQNLYFQIAVAAGVPTQTLTIDHNLIDGYRGTEGETRGSNDVEGDPLFVNAAGANFNLREGSPAINAGSAAGAPSDDFDGRSRPLDGNGDGTAAYDIGAFEMPFYSEHAYLLVVLRGY